MVKNSFWLMALLCIFTITISNESSADTRKIHIVGSSTVYPFATAVAEEFGATTSFGTPTIESTGSGGGFKLFCAGIGLNHPDITNASRAIKSTEVELCKKNGVTDISEVVIGYDGIVIANTNSVKPIEITIDQLFLALAQNVSENRDGTGKLVPNFYKKWSDIDPSLPDVKIEVLGPPPTSGTRDAFVELVMHEGCHLIQAYKDMPKKQRKKACGMIREDGAYIDAGENDNLIIQKLTKNPNSYGIFGYSFLDRNYDLIHGALVNGVEPEFENIASGDYPLSRPLFFYVKRQHIGVVPGIQEYVTEFFSEKAVGEDGYLEERGLIPLIGDKRDEAVARAQNEGIITY